MASILSGVDVETDFIKNMRPYEEEVIKFIVRNTASKSSIDKKRYALSLIMYLEKKMKTTKHEEFEKYLNNSDNLTKNQLECIYNATSKITPEPLSRFGTTLAMNYFAPRQQNNLNVKRGPAKGSSVDGGPRSKENAQNYQGPESDDDRLSSEDELLGDMYEFQPYYNSVKSKIDVEKLLNGVTVLGSKKKDKVICANLLLYYQHSAEASTAGEILKLEEKALMNERLLPNLRSVILGMEIKQMSLLRNNFIRCYFMIYVPKGNCFTTAFKRVRKEFGITDDYNENIATKLFMNEKATTNTEEYQPNRSNLFLIYYSRPQDLIRNLSTDEDMAFFFYNTVAFVYCTLNKTYKPETSTTSERILMVIIRISTLMMLVTAVPTLKQCGLLASGYNPMLSILFEGSCHETNRRMAKIKFDDIIVYTLTASMDDLFFYKPPDCDSLSSSTTTIRTSLLRIKDDIQDEELSRRDGETS